MRRARWMGSTLGVSAGLVLAMAGSGATLAQAPRDPAHPAPIPQGICPAPGAVLAPLGDVSTAFLVDGVPTAGALPVGAGSASPVAASVTTLPLSLSDLVAADHAIVVHASAADMDTYLVCGDIGGLTMGDGDLPIGLGPVNGSGYAGVAWLSDGGDGSTLVRILLTQPDAGAPGPVGSPAPISSAAPDTESVTLDSRVWWGGFDMTFTGATHDPTTGEVLVSGTFTNAGTGPQSLLRLAIDNGLKIAWDGQLIDASFLTGAEVPGGAGVEDSIGAVVPDSFRLEDAVLTLGAPTEHQALVPLAAGVPATSDVPVPVDVFGRAVNKGVLTVTALDARILPATCDGTPSAVAFYPAPADQLSLVLRVRERAGRDGAVATAFATKAGGVSAPGTPGATSLLDARQTINDAQYCFTLPAPIQGDVDITVESRTTGVIAKQRSFTITIP